MLTLQNKWAIKIADHVPRQFVSRLLCLKGRVIRTSSESEATKSIFINSTLPRWRDKGLLTGRRLDGLPRCTSSREISLVFMDGCAVQVSMPFIWPGQCTHGLHHQASASSPGGFKLEKGSRNPGEV